MEIQDIRRMRLAELIKENYRGSQSRFVDETGENQGEVSALLKNKSFGEKKARKLEEKCGLPAGWLDQPPAPSEEVVGETIPRTPPSSSTFRIVESVERARVALIYATPEEIDLLTCFRQATDLGKGIIQISAATAEKKLTHLADHQS